MYELIQIPKYSKTAQRNSITGQLQWESHINNLKMCKNGKVWRIRQKSVKNLTSEWNQKQQHFFPHAFTWFLCIRFVPVATRSEEEVCWRRGPSATYFAPPWIHPWADLAEKQQHLYRTMSTSSLPSFIKIHQAVLEKKSKMCSNTCIIATPPPLFFQPK